MNGVPFLPSSLKTVCIMLGPYRNLTTLTASIAFLHPGCQVLNHAMDRVFADESRNFISTCSESAFHNFISYALSISDSGERGDHGGSITFSHAFDSVLLRDAYAARFGTSLMKKEITCFFWKESLRMSNALKENHADFEKLFLLSPKLKFLLPIRDPLDAAVSNMKTKHHRLFKTISEYSLTTVLDAILSEIAWFLDLESKYPRRFLSFLQNEFHPAFLDKLASFLEISEDSLWRKQAMDCYVMKPSYPRDEVLLKHLKAGLEEKLPEHPEMMEKIFRLASSSG